MQPCDKAFAVMAMPNLTESRFVWILISRVLITWLTCKYITYTCGIPQKIAWQCFYFFMVWHFLCQGVFYICPYFPILILFISCSFSSLIPTTVKNLVHYNIVNLAFDTREWKKDLLFWISKNFSFKKNQNYKRKRFQTADTFYS